MYGAQARGWHRKNIFMFENDVNMYGAQAQIRQSVPHYEFENDVNMYGAQAPMDVMIRFRCLRMM